MICITHVRCGCINYLSGENILSLKLEQFKESAVLSPRNCNPSCSLGWFCITTKTRFRLNIFASLLNIMLTHAVLYFICLISGAFSLDGSPPKRPLNAQYDMNKLFHRLANLPHQIPANLFPDAICQARGSG